MHSTKVAVEKQARKSLKETENDFPYSQLSDLEDVQCDLEFDTSTDRRGESANGVSSPFRHKFQNANRIVCNIPNNTQGNGTKF